MRHKLNSWMHSNQDMVITHLATASFLSSVLILLTVAVF